MKKVCKICGKEFETNMKVKVTCSRECRDENNRRMTRERNRRRPKPLPMPQAPLIKVCQICGEEYTATSKSQKYCISCGKERRREQKRDYGNRRYKEKIASEVKTCIICGKQFETTDRRRKTCCHACKMERQRHTGAIYRTKEQLATGNIYQEPIDKGWYERYARCPKDPRKLDKTLAKLKRDGIEYADAQKADTIRMFARIEI